MVEKKCRDCGDIYETEDKEIKLYLNHKDIEALEERLFIKQTEKQFKATRTKIHKIWKQICDGEEKWREERWRKGKVIFKNL